VSDNTTLTFGSGGDTISTEDLGGVKITRVKIATGGHGTDGGDIASTNPVPAQLFVNGGTQSVCHNAAVAGTVTTAKSGAGNLYGWSIGNPTGSIVYLKLFDSVSATLGTTVPNIGIMIPANSTVEHYMPMSWSFATGLQYAATNTQADSGVNTMTNSIVMNLFYS
jgi:hypothetical protein